MTSLFRKFKSKIRPVGSVSGQAVPTHPQTSRVEAPPTPRTETRLSLSDVVDVSLSSLQERLWNQVYDELKASEPKVVDEYETILLNQLHPNSNGENEIGKTADTRCEQMQQLVQDGLDRSRKEASIKQNIGQVLEVVQSVRGVVESAVQAAPLAAVAWVGVCIGLEIISKPISEARSNRQGITYVVSRMNWYWNLARLLLNENKAINASAGLRDEMERHISQLYKKLLSYQIKTICLYHRKPLIAVGRDLLSLDDWAGQLSDIQVAEESVRRDVEQYSSEQIKKYMSDLNTTAVSQGEKLDNIHSSIEFQTQQQEQRYQDEKDNQCLKDLYESDPRRDKERIEATKGGLLRDSCLWIFENAEFLEFCAHPQSRLLWIKGDPGKGKTMLLCGIIEELQREKEPDFALSYFFCQATEARLSNATSVLRGLLYVLLKQRPSLISYLRKEYDTAGKKLFQGDNVWVTLVGIFTEMLKDTDLNDAILVVDAIDECSTDWDKLLEFIVQSSAACNAKWIISSRRTVEIEQKLGRAQQKISLSLELNGEVISKAIDTYIVYKVNQLVIEKGFGKQTKIVIEKHLAENARGTFLWVALVCKELEKPALFSEDAIGILTSFPSGLSALYTCMMEKIQSLPYAVRCNEILATVLIVYRPISLHELKILSNSLESFSQKDLETLVTCCSSFLSLRENVIYFVHQSAKDYLLDNASDQIQQSDSAEQHHNIFLRSITALSQTLRRDIYGLNTPGLSVDQISTHDVDPLAHIRYSTVYWVNHLGDSRPEESYHDRDEEDNSIVHDFIRTKYVYWLESLSLLHSMPEGVTSLQRLKDLTRETKSQELVNLLQDASRFILSHRKAIETAPLQVYASALVFSPTGSLIRSLFKKEEPDLITLNSSIRADWDECLQTLEGHLDAVKAVVISHDSRLVASASRDKTIRIWRVGTGECIKVITGHKDSVTSVAFSHNSEFLASASSDNTIRIWKVNTGECVNTLTGHGDVVMSVAFSQNSERIASASFDRTIRIWLTDTGECIKTLTGHNDTVVSVVFSHDSELIASASYDNTIRIWQADAGDCIRAITGHNSSVYSVAFSYNSELLASASSDNTIRIWKVDTGEGVRMLTGHEDSVMSVAFSHDSEELASASFDNTVRIWRMDNGECVQTLKGHDSWVLSVAFSHDSKLVVSASQDSTLRIWHVQTGEYNQGLTDQNYSPLSDTGKNTQAVAGHSDLVWSVVFSPDSKLVASASEDKTTLIWRADTGECMQTLVGHRHSVSAIHFSHDSKMIASGSVDASIRMWRVDTGECVQTLTGHNSAVTSIVFSHNSELVASTSYDKTVRIWRPDTGECVQVFVSENKTATSVAFSYDSELVVAASSFRENSTIQIWRMGMGQSIVRLKGHTEMVASLAFSHNSELVSSASKDTTIRIWRADTGECTKIVVGNITPPISILSFAAENTRLLTSHGTLALHKDMASAPSAADPIMVFTGPDVNHITQSGSWVVLNGERTLWLPVEFRPYC